MTNPADPSPPTPDPDAAPTVTPHDAGVLDIARRFDPAVLATWLNSRPNGHATIADSLRIGDDFDLSGFHKCARIDRLLARAQHDNVFGLPDHTIAILHLTGDRDFIAGHRIAVTFPDGVMLCSDHKDTIDLLTDHLCGVDAAIHLLTVTADATTALLHQRLRLTHPHVPIPTADLVTESVTRPAGRAIRPLAGTDPATPDLAADHGHAAARPGRSR